MTQLIEHLRPLRPEADPIDMVRWNPTGHGSHSFDFLEQHSEDVRDLYPKTNWRDSESHGQFRAITSPMEVWKKAMYCPEDLAKFQIDAWQEALVRMCIPVGAIVYAHHQHEHVGNHPLITSEALKMRASLVKVLDVRLLPSRRGNPGMGFNDLVWLRSAFSGWDTAFTYYSGCTVEPRLPFSGRWGQCESGIHFFIRPVDAELYTV